MVTWVDYYGVTAEFIDMLDEYGGVALLIWNILEIPYIEQRKWDYLYYLTLASLRLYGWRNFLN